jgi:hypothetical protein
MELFSSDDLLIPILFKVRGSYDVPDSCVISSSHFFELARLLAVESRLLEVVGEIARRTPIVFLGMGFLTPEFRLAVETLLKNDLSSEHHRYLFQPRPDLKSDDCFQRLEAGIWDSIKARAVDRNVTVVETAPEDALRQIAQRLDSVRK